MVRRVAEDLEVYEEFLGLYSVESIDAAMISTVIKDLFIRMNLSLESCVGSVMMARVQWAVREVVLLSELQISNPEQCTHTAMATH